MPDSIWVRTTGTDVSQGVSFGIFGLGNKQYEHFCAVGRRVQAAMLGLGASSVIRNGEGDDDEDIEADFDKWREELFEVLEFSPLIQKPANGKVCFWLTSLHIL